MLGFCSVDGFESMPKGRHDEKQPEDGIQQYIKSSAEMLGVALFEQRITNALENFAQLTRDMTVNPTTIINTCVKTVIECVLYAHAIDVYEVRPQLSEQQRTFRRSLRRSMDKGKRSDRASSSSASSKMSKKDRVRRNITGTMAISAALEVRAMQARVAAKSRSARNLNDDDNDENPETLADAAQMKLLGVIKKRAHWGGSVLIESDWDQAPLLNSQNMFPSVLDAVNTQFSEACSYVIAKRPEFVVCKFRDVDFSKKGDDDAAEETPYFVCVVQRQMHALWPEDAPFMDQLAKIAELTFNCVRGREHRKNARKTAIENIQSICASWRDTEIADFVQKSINEALVPLEKTDIYCGQLEHGGHAITYIGASHESCMLGKRLKRGKGVSFSAIDSGWMVTVRNENAAKAMGVHMFIDVRIQGWPYVCVPMRRGNLVRGILAIDSFDNSGKGRQDEEHPEKGVPEFLNTVGEFLGTAIDRQTKMRALSKLNTITRNYAATVSQVYNAALECLRSNVAFAQGVHILEITGARPLPYGADVADSTIDVSKGGCVILEIMEAKNLAKADLIGASDPFCEIIFNGKIIGRTVTRDNTLNPFWANEHFELEFISGATNTLSIQVFDEDDKEKSDFLGQADFTNAELRTFQHNKKLTKTLTVDPGLSREKNKLVKGTLSLNFLAAPVDGLDSESDEEDGVSEEEVQVEISIISAHDLAKADMFGASDPVAILHFNGEEVARTKTIDNDLNPVWKKKFPFTIKEKHRNKNMTVSIYDMDAMSVGDFLGCVVISGKDIMFPSTDTQHRKLEPNPKLGKKGNKLVQGTFKYAITRLFSEANKRRWNLLRSQVKVAARQQFKEELIKNPDDVEKMVRMGMLCAQTTQGGTVNMVRCAAVLLTIAADKGYEGDGKFWRALAATHMRTWLAEGLRAERLHLEKSCDAYEEALKFMENAIDVECWVQAAYTNQLLGRSERAAQTLGTIMKNFPNYADGSRICLQAAVILTHLGRFDQAVNYLTQVHEKGDVPNPYSSRDLVFIEARINEKWGAEEGDPEKTAVAMKLYETCFQAKKERGDIDLPDVETWLHQGSTWRDYGEKCSIGGHFTFTIDLFRQAVDRDPDGSNSAKLIFGLAKAQYRCGNVGEAIRQLKKAVRIDPKNKQLAATLEAWKNPKPHFKDDIALSIEQLLGVYLDGKAHPMRQIHVHKVLTRKRPSKPIELERAITVKSLPWRKLRYHVQAAARQFYKMKVLKDEGKDPRMIATLGMLCFDRSMLSKGHIMRASAIFLKRAHSMWELVDPSAAPSSPTHLDRNESEESEENNKNLDEIFENQHHSAAVSNFPYNKKLAQSMFSAWLSDGIMGEREMLKDSMQATKAALLHIESVIDVEMWMQLARTQMYLGQNAAAVVTFKQIMHRFPHNIKLFAQAELELAMVYKLLGKYDAATTILKECVSKAKQGLLVYNRLEVEFVLSRVYELWQETDSSKAVIAQMGYQTVLESLQDEGFEDFEENVNEWLTSAATWQRYARKCEHCGHFGFAKGLYKEAFAREAEAATQHTLWYGYAKCLFMCGEVSDAIQAMDRAVALTVGIEQHAQDNDRYSKALVHWRSPHDFFKEECDGPIERPVATYLAEDSPEEVLIARELIMLEIRSVNQPRWQLIHANIRRLARDHYAQTEMVNMLAGDPFVIGRMGMLCYEENSTNVQMTYCGCLLLQKAFNFGLKTAKPHENVISLGMGRFFKCLADSHLKVWTFAGVRAKRINLEMSAAAWDMALTHLENAVNLEQWEKCATVHTALGDFKRAAAILGHMIQSFPNHKNLGNLYIKAASVLVRLGLWEQAAAYMQAAISLDSLAIVGKLDLYFMMATLFMQWGEHDGSFEKKRMIANAAYEKVFETLYEQESEEAGDARDTLEWLAMSNTWAGIGERCMSAQLYLFANMFFERAVECLIETARKKNFRVAGSMRNMYEGLGMVGSMSDESGGGLLRKQSNHLAEEEQRLAHIERMHQIDGREREQETGQIALLSLAECGFVDIGGLDENTQERKAFERREETLRRSGSMPVSEKFAEGGDDEENDSDEGEVRRRSLTLEESSAELSLASMSIIESPADMLRRGRISYKLGKSLLRVGDDGRALDFLREAAACGVSSKLNSGVSSFFALGDDHDDFHTAHKEQDTNSYSANTSITSSFANRNRLSSDGGHEAEDAFFGLRKTRNYDVDMEKDAEKIIATFAGIFLREPSVLSGEMGSASLLTDSAVSDQERRGSTLENLLGAEESAEGGVKASSSLLETFLVAEAAGGDDEKQGTEPAIASGGLEGLLGQASLESEESLGDLPPGSDMPAFVGGLEGLLGQAGLESEESLGDLPPGSDVLASEALAVGKEKEEKTEAAGFSPIEEPPAIVNVSARASPVSFVLDDAEAATNAIATTRHASLITMRANMMTTLQSSMSDLSLVGSFGLPDDDSSTAEEAFTRASVESFEQTLASFAKKKVVKRKSKKLASPPAEEVLPLPPHEPQQQQSQEDERSSVAFEDDNSIISASPRVSPRTSKAAVKLDTAINLEANSVISDAPPKPSVWITMRKNIRAAAREYYRDELCENPRDVAMIVRMGSLCMDSSSNPNPGTTKVAAVLLQKAANFGYDGDGRFWANLATAHLKAYKLAGLRSERVHLTMARSAWDIAMTHFEIATNVQCHILNGETGICLGNYERAIKAYGTVMTTFSRNPEIPSVRMKMAMLYAARNEHQEAITFLHDSIASGKHPPYTKSDVMLLIARVHEQWGELLNDKFQKKLGNDTFMRAYEVSGTVDLPLKDWMESPQTFLAIAEKADAAQHHLFAIEMYLQAIERMAHAPKIKTVNKSKMEEAERLRKSLSQKLYFGLSKMYCKAGNMAKAIDAVVKAIEFDPTNDQVLATARAWENPEQRLEHDLTMPTEELLENYLSSTLKDLHGLPSLAPIRREVTFEICSCADLKKADKFGSSDPFCVVTFAGKEILRTRTIQDNCNPKFTNERVSFVMPENLSRTSLVVEVFDADPTGTGDFLGMMKLPASGLLDAPPPLESVTIQLEANDELKKKANKLVGGCLSVKWAVYNSVFDDTEPTLASNGSGDVVPAVQRTVPRLALRIHIVSAKGLGQADKFGLSDPFIKIKFDGQEVAKTTVKDNTLSPLWDERFVLTLPAEDIKTGAASNRSGSENKSAVPVNGHELMFEIWDDDGALGVGEFLGQIVFDSDFFMHAPPKIKGYELEKKEGMPVTEQTFVQGSLRLGFELGAGDFGYLTEGVDKDGVFEVEIDVLAAFDLAKADSFASDPFAIVKWGGVEVGKTEVVSKSVDPRWKKGVFMLTILEKELHAGADNTEKELTIEVWDHNKLGSGSFLGGLAVNKDAYAHASGRKLEAELQPLEHIIGDTTDPRNARKLDLVQGVISFKISPVEDRSTSNISSFNASNENIDIWSIIGGICDTEKFDISQSKNRVDITKQQVNQVLCSRAKGKRSSTLHGSPQTIVAPIFDAGMNILGRLVGPELGTLHCLQVVRTPGYDWSEDVVFTGMVAEEVEKAIRAIRGRQQRVVARKNSLLMVKRLCSDWANTDIILLKKRVLNYLNACLPRSNVYFGMLQPGGSTIRYTVASKGSSMVGKELSRADAKGVAFSLIGAKRREHVVCVRDQVTGDVQVLNDQETKHDTFSFLSNDVRGDEVEEMPGPKMLGNTKNHFFPFLCAPLINKDCSIGVIGIDTLNYVGKGRHDDAEPEEGVLDFVKKVGLELGTAIDKKRKLEALSKLEGVVDNVFVKAEDVYIETLKVIANNVLTSSAAEIWHLNGRDWSLGVLASIACNSVGSVGAIYDEGLELKVEWARNLGKADSFGESDSFCKVFWNDKLIGKTKVISSNANPDWNEFFFIMPPSRGDPMELRVEVWDMDFSGEGDFLGQVTLGDKLMLRPPKDNMAVKLGTMAGFSKKQNSLVKGKISLKLESAAGDHRYREIEFNILDAHGLAKADMFGLSDPVVVIKWDGGEIDRSIVIQDSLDPVFNNHFVVKVPEVFDEHQKLTLEVYDMDLMGLGDFLGRVEFDSETLLNPPKNTRIDYELVANPELTPKQNKLVQGKLRVHFGSSKDVMPAHFRQLDIEECRGLAKADTFGKSDPLVIAYYDGNEVFRTKTLSDTMDPLWISDNTCVVGLPETVFEGRFLELRVYDDDVGGIGDFLGMTRVSCQALMDVGKEEGEFKYGRRKAVKLEKDPALSDKANTLVKGNITFRLQDVKAITEGEKDEGARVKVRICVKSAHNLAKADTFGKSDPYAVVKYDNRMVGKTRYMDSTLNPEWNDSKFVVHVLPDVDEEVKFEVRVYDRDMVGSHDFLGRVEQNAVDLLDPKGFGMMKERGLRKDEALKEYENKLVAGTVKLGFGFDEEGGMVESGGLGSLRIGESGVRLHILSCKGLAKADFFGKSDPMVIVRVDGDAWHETATVKDDMDPVFGNEMCVLPLDRVVKLDEDDLPSLEDKKEVEEEKKEGEGGVANSAFGNRARKDSSVHFGSCVAPVVEEESNDDDSVDEKEKKKEEAEGGSDRDSDSSDGKNKDAPKDWGREKVILEVWDMDVGGKGDFLGRVGINKEDMEDFEYMNKVHTLELTKCPDLPESSNKLVKPGNSTISVRFTATDFDLEANPREKKIMHVVEAFGLAKADRFGLSDPFAIVKMNNKEVGKTKVINDTMQPLWDDEFVVELPRNEDDFMELCIEIYDADAFVTGDFLGMVRLTTKDLLQLRGGKLEFELAPNPLFKKKENKLVQGSLVLVFTDYNGKKTDAMVDKLLNIAKGAFASLGGLLGGGEAEEEEEVVSAPVDAAKIVTTVTVDVKSATSLLKADMFGESDPFVVARFGGVKIGKSKTKSDTLFPVWEQDEATFHIEVPDKVANMNLSIELWDEDFGGITGDFLGSVEVGIEMLLHPPAGEVEFELKNRRGWTDNKRKRITGSVVLGITKKKTRQRALVFAPPAERKRQKHQFLTQNVIVAPNLKEEEMRMATDDSDPSMHKIFSRVSKKVLGNAVMLDGIVNDPSNVSGDTGAMVDGVPVISELGAGQIIGAWLRQVKYTLVPGVPDRLVMPFHDYFKEDSEESSSDEEVVEGEVVMAKENEKARAKERAVEEDYFGPLPEMMNKYAVVVSCHAGLVCAEDEDFCKLASDQMESALTIIRQREMRVRDQKESRLKIKKACAMWDRLPDSKSLLAFVVKEVGSVLIGTTVYLSLVQPGGEVLKIEITTDETYMGGTLTKGKEEGGRGVRGLAFDCVEYGSIYVALGGWVKRSHVGWSNRITQSSLPDCELVSKFDVGEGGEGEDLRSFRITLERAYTVCDEDFSVAKEGEEAKKEAHGGPPKHIQSLQSQRNVKATFINASSKDMTAAATPSGTIDTTKYWLALRSKVKVAARLYAFDCLKNNVRDVKYFAHFGHLFVDTGPGATHDIHKTAALLLQKASNMGWCSDSSDALGGGEGGGKFWFELADSHLRTYLSGGLKADRVHLEYSVVAWKKALNYLQNATNSYCWMQCAMAYEYLGDYKEASLALGQLISHFPNMKRLHCVLFETSTLMKRLKRYEQASNFLYKCIMMKKSFKPYTTRDLKMAMGSILEEWARSVKSNEKMAMAKEYYMEVYRETFGLEEGVDVKEGGAKGGGGEGGKGWGKKKKVKQVSYDEWIHSVETWSGFAVTCCLASDFILAVDYYKKAIEEAEKFNKKLMKGATASAEGGKARSSVRRVSKLEVSGSIMNGSLAKVWFALAKCQMRSGEREHAKNSLQRAVMLDHSSMQMQSFLDSWVSGSSR